MTSIYTDTAVERGTPVFIPAGSVALRGSLDLPRDPRGLVIVANGDGDHFYDDGNAAVARALVDAGFAVLTVELLTPHELAEDAETSALRFDEILLAARLAKVTAWTRSHWQLGALEVGYLAAGLCAAAALAATSVRPIAKSVVCRSARVEDGRWLERVSAQVLLLAGERDAPAQRAGCLALSRLRGNARMEILPGARHFLDEPATVDRTARIVEAWFARTLAGAALWKADAPSLGFSA